MRPVYITGTGMTEFGRFAEESLKSLGARAVTAALADAACDAKSLDAAFVANSMAGIVTGQESIRGQVVLNPLGIGGIPIFNVENACASSSTALHLAWQGIASGAWDRVLLLGVEKLFHADKSVSYRALGSAMDVDEYPNTGEGSPFVELASRRAQVLLDALGTGREILGRIAAKTRNHGKLNPLAQYRGGATVEQVMASPAVTANFTRLMCAPIGDGAAALVLTAAPSQRDGHAVQLAGTSVGSATADRAPHQPIVSRVAQSAYSMAQIVPADIDVVELHDTTSFNELVLYEQLGLFPREDLVRAAEEGWTALGGRLPVNTSGGLLSRGHPVGATGAAQICELTAQLRREAGERQVDGALVGVAQNGGGHVGAETAAMAVSVLKRVSA